ncbi:MAG: hypothetical protein WB767_08365 [Nocardioides sp.]
MSVLSGQVLVGAALLASPALWQGLVTGTMPIDVALIRYLVVVCFVWMALSVVASLVGDVTPARREPSSEPVDDEAAPPQLR